MAAQEEEVLHRKSSQLSQDFWTWRLKNFPEFATSVGEHCYDNKLIDMSLGGFHKRYLDSKTILDEVDSLILSFRTNGLSCNNLEVLQFELQTFTDGYSYLSHLCPISILEGPHINFSKLLSLMPRDTLKDHENIISRLEAFSTHIDDIIALMREGIKNNITLHAYSVYPLLKKLKKLISLPIIESPFFESFLEKSITTEPTKWKNITVRGVKVIQTHVYPAFDKLIKFIDNEYLAHTREKPSIESLPNGEDYYLACLNYHTSTELTPSDIHNIGVREVQRIQNRANDLLRAIGFQGSYVELIKQLNKDTHCLNSLEIVKGYSKIYDDILNELPKFFNCLPGAKCDIKIMSNSSFPGGLYQQGNEIQPGVFWINSDKITGITYKAQSLALHEMIPGHHLQSNIVMQKALFPKFRKFRESGNYYTIPGRFPLYTALMEGWAMYAEYLGEELGMYKDPYTLLGRLFNEIFRAARLVVDTGLHSFDWSKEQAVNYMMEVIGMKTEFASSEVDRYITWPGQACSYKVGELKIKDFRDMMCQELGEKFDIKDFHDLVLQNGEVPFEVIEKDIRFYIKTKKFE